MKRETASTGGDVEEKGTTCKSDDLAAEAEEWRVTRDNNPVSSSLRSWPRNHRAYTSSRRGTGKDKDRIRPPKTMSERLGMSWCDQESLLGSPLSPKTRRYSRIKYIRRWYSDMQGGFLFKVKFLMKWNIKSSNETQFHDFNDKAIVISVVGYLRPELPFNDLEKLTAAIKQTS